MDYLSKSDPQVILYTLIGNTWVLHSKTEIIWDNLNPNFVKTFQIEYIFEKQQKLKFEVRDVDDERGLVYETIGSVETTLSKLFGAQNQTTLLNLTDKGKDTGKIIFKVDKERTSAHYLTL
jgi:hypothetical protein